MITRDSYQHSYHVSEREAEGLHVTRISPLIMYQNIKLKDYRIVRSFSSADMSALEGTITSTDISHWKTGIQLLRSQDME